MRSWSFFIACVLMFDLSPVNAQSRGTPPSTGVLKTCLEVQQLSPSQLRLNLTVDLNVVILAFDPVMNLVIVEDDTGILGCRVSRLTQAKLNLRRGDYIHLTGDTMLVLDQPRIRLKTFSYLGVKQTSYSKPFSQYPTHPRQLSDGLFRIQGFVVRTNVRQDGLVLQVRIGTDTLPCLLRFTEGFSITAASLLQKRIRLDGIFLKKTYEFASYPENEIILIPDPDSIQVIGDMAELAKPLRPQQLQIQSPKELITFRGTLEISPQRQWQIQHQGVTVSLDLAAESDLEAGETIEVEGFLNPPTPERVLFVTKTRRLLPTSDADPWQWAILRESVAEIRSKAKAGDSVYLQGFCIFAIPEQSAFWLHDGENTIRVELEGTTTVPNVGARITVRGTLLPDSSTFRVRGEELHQSNLIRIPPGQLVTHEDLLGGYEDDQWISIRGVIREVTADESGKWMLQLHSHRRSITIRLDQATASPLSLEGAIAHITGIVQAKYDATHQWVGAEIISPNLDYIQVIRPAVIDPYTLPITPIESIPDLSRKDPFGSFIKLRGRLNFRASVAPKLMCMEDTTGGILLRPRENQPGKIGDEIEAVGYLSFNEPNWYLEQVQLRIITPSEAKSDLLPEYIPTVLTSSVGRRIVLTGEVIENIRSDSGSGMLLRLGGNFQKAPPIEAVIAKEFLGDFEPFPVGCTVSVPGVLTWIRRPEAAGRYHLWVTEPQRIIKISSPSWWNPERVRLTLIAVTILITGFLLSSVWLRRVIRRQTLILQKRFQEQLELEARYRDMVENACDIIFTTDLEGKIQSINHAAETITGYPRYELEGKQFIELKERIAPSKEWEDAEITPQIFESQIHHRNGTKIHLEVSLRPLVKDNKRIGFEGVARDISQRHHAEQAFRQAMELQRLHLENSPVAFIEWDREFHVVRWSAQAERIFGWKAEEVLGLRFYDWKFVHPDDMHEVTEIARELLWESVPRNRCSNRNYRRDGTIAHCNWYNSSLRDANGQTISVLSLVLDESERYRAEAERNQLEEQFRHAQKMEAIGRLAGGIAHDFNNLLTVINGNASLLQQFIPAGETEQELIEEIAKAGDQAAILTRQLLTFSRKQLVSPRNLDLHLLIEDTLKLLRRLIPENIAIRVEHDEFIPKIKGDPTLIAQILMNLAINARDAMPHGGSLTISTHRCITEEVLMQIQDTGVGMDPETCRRAFEPFFTTKPVGVGTGLGLSTVYSIVQQSQGRIEIQSKLKEGTTFQIWLPISGSTYHSVIAPTPLPENIQHHLTVLLVEDEEMVRALAQRVLESQGYQVLVAEHGHHALQILDSHPEVRLVLTDVMMPGMSGRELAEQVQRRNRAMKVVFMSGYTSDEVLRQGIQADLVEFLQKPFTPAQLIDKLNLVMSKEIREAKTSIGVG